MICNLLATTLLAVPSYAWPVAEVSTAVWVENPFQVYWRIVCCPCELIGKPKKAGHYYVQDNKSGVKCLCYCDSLGCKENGGKDE